MISASEALTQLQAGNRRFAAGQPHNPHSSDAERRAASVAGQAPFAVILGCSDSRVPAELVFDQGIGDLFVIRVAGNIVAPSLIGSVEFAVGQFGTPLVVVMGHTGCGAVIATLQALRQPESVPSPNLNAIVTRIRPTLITLHEMAPELDEEQLLGHAVRANVRASVSQLRQGSRLLEDAVVEGRLRILGAEYNLATGEVDFFEDE
ncbi:MAG: carbonic anhydrase [Anaerolineales bacterium]|nr:carbonic anhydrase [Anaerolineales bacterium]MCB9126747.1 carbonic anhydrase [Ardenticatenales bacterium]